jgi:hypothetical protein
MRSLANGRALLGRCAVSLAMVGCTPEDVVIEQPPPPYEGRSSASCVAEPRAFAHVPGVLPELLGMGEVNLYVVASAGTDGSGAQSLWRVPKDNSPPQRLATSETPIRSLTADSDFGVTTLYWTTAGDGGATGAVWSLGSEPTDEPIVIASNRSAPRLVLPESSNLYWFEQGKDSSGQSVEVLAEMLMTGGPITRIQTFDADDVPAGIGGYDAINAFFWTTGSEFLGNQSTSEVVEFPLSGSSGPVRITGPDAGGAGAIGLDAHGYGLLYSAPNAIIDVPLALDGGLGAPQTLATTDGFVDDIENDANSVYFVDRSTAQLMAVPRRDADAAPPARTLANCLAPATELELDDECVYWIDAPSATIMMVKK